MNNKPAVVILMRAISRYNGAVASALDIAEALHALGFDLYAGLASSRRPPRVGDHRFIATTIPKSRIITKPKELSAPRRGDGTPATKGKLRSRLRSLADNKSRSFDILRTADLVIDAIGLDARGVQFLRRNTDAPFIRNHAGSPEAFENYFIRREHLVDPDTLWERRYNEYCERYDGLIFEAQVHAEECIERDAMAASRCFILPPSCQEEDVLAAKRLASPYAAGRKAIVCVGSIQPRKGQRHAIDAFSRIAENHPDTDLHLIGGEPDTEYSRELRNVAGQRGLEQRIVFHGHRGDHLRFMAHADMLLQSSVAEGISRVLVEAMLMKLPIVSFGISGTASILEADREGLLVALGDTGAMASGLAQLLANGDRRGQIAEAAHKRYLLNHSRACYAGRVRDMVSFFARESRTPS